MAIKFSPDGFLDVATEPTQLPSEVSEKDESSGAMVRCTNLQLDRQGIAKTRNGISRITASALDETSPSLMVEQEGKRYAFSGTKIYEDEANITTGLLPGNWSAVKYGPYNSVYQNIYAINGYNRKRIEDSIVYNWGSEAPSDTPTVSLGAGTGLTGSYNVKFTYCRCEGSTVVFESNPSTPATDNLTLTNQSIKIRFDYPEDPQVNAIKIYRTDLSGTNYYLLKTIYQPSSSYTHAYTYDWEANNAHIAGTGYDFTLLARGITSTSYGQINMINCDAISDTMGTWSVVSGASTSLGLVAWLAKEGTACLHCYQGLDTSAIVKYTRTTGYWDLSAYNQIRIWIYNTNSPIYSLNFYFGETNYNEQSYGSFNLTTAGWHLISWDISGISPSARNRVTEFGFSITGANETSIFLDYIHTDDAPVVYESDWYKAIYSWEPYGTTTDIEIIKLYAWEPIVLDDNTADSSLGTLVAEDHDPPPYGTMVFGPSYTGMLFILKENLMHYSKEKQPEYWPSNYYIEVTSRDFICKSGCIHDGQVYIATERDIYQVQGTSHDTFSPPLSMSAITGTISHQCMLSIHGYGIVHLGSDGIYLMSSKDENITNSRFKPIFDGTTVGSIPGVSTTNLKNSWMLYFNNKLYFAYPKSGSTYPDNIIVTDLSTLKCYHFDYGRTFPTAAVDITNWRIIALDTSGYVWKLEDPSSTDDEGNPIAWQIESKEYSDQLRKYFPRWARYDITIGAGATANSYILLNGTSRQTHSLTESRKTRKRLITGCTGDRISIRIMGTGPVDIFAAEVE